MDLHKYYMNIAEAMSKNSTCISRQVGCVLVNYSWGLVSSGYNGAARSLKNCSNETCNRLYDESGTNLHKCIAIHAEANALLSCNDISKIDAAYVTLTPCLQCMCLLLNTSCTKIYYKEYYSGSEYGIKLWESTGRKIYNINY